MNWELEKFFLAQAPGPSVGPSQIQEISSKTTNITSNPISGFSTTWAKNWAPIIDSSTPKTIQAMGTGLGRGAKAGVGVGVALVSIVIAAAVLFFFARRRRRNRVQHQDKYLSDREPIVDETQANRAHEIAGQEPKEIGKGQAHEMGEGQIHEVGEGNTVHEIGVSHTDR